MQDRETVGNCGKLQAVGSCTAEIHAMNQWQRSASIMQRSQCNLLFTSTWGSTSQVELSLNSKRAPVLCFFGVLFP